MSVKPSEIKMQKRRKASLWTPVRQCQLLMGSLRMVKFVLGPDFANALQAGLYRVLPFLSDDADDASLQSSDSSAVAHNSLQEA